MPGSPRRSRTLNVLVVGAVIILILVVATLTVLWLTEFRYEDSRLLTQIHNDLRPHPRTRRDHLPAPAFRIKELQPSPENTLFGSTAAPINPALRYQIEDDTYFEFENAALSPRGDNLALIYCANKLPKAACDAMEIEMRSLNNDVRWLASSEQAYCVKWAGFSHDGQYLITQGCKECEHWDDYCPMPIIQVWPADSGQNPRAFWGGQDFPRGRPFIQEESVFFRGHATATVIDGHSVADESPQDILQCSLATDDCHAILRPWRERLLDLVPAPDGKALLVSLCQEDDPMGCLTPPTPESFSVSRKWAVAFFPPGADQPQWTAALEGIHPGDFTVSPSGAYLVTDDLQLLSAQTGAFIRELDPGQPPENTLVFANEPHCFFAYQSYFLFSSDDRTLFRYNCADFQVWELASGRWRGKYHASLPYDGMSLSSFFESPISGRQILLGRCTRTEYCEGCGMYYCFNGAMWIYSW
jgi:hypothetical protein